MDQIKATVGLKREVNGPEGGVREEIYGVTKDEQLLI
jgi:hypothetical protein